MILTGSDLNKAGILTGSDLDKAGILTGSDLDRLGSVLAGKKSKAESSLYLHVYFLSRLEQKFNLSLTTD